MEDLVKEYHKTQYRNKDRVPYVEHLIGVKSILSSVLEITGECKDEVLLGDMLDAALGHDLIEDTSVSKDEIMNASDERVLHLIEELSNPVDDTHTDEYMKQISNASEEARVIKYCDLLENTTSVCYGLQDLGIGWFYNFYEPILKRTTDNLANTEFINYPKTANLLRSALKMSTSLLYDKLKLYRKENNGRIEE
ncbi:MAG: HD domain-containing protein [Candidatus Saccharibacteria bacterium]|nr:HD domain-containing protein [Candidatus Saccharibacteria bacterium]